MEETSIGGGAAPIRPRHCLFCEAAMERTEPGRGRIRPGHHPPQARSRPRQAYDPELGRLWDICPRCGRWNPVPLTLRWETIETWEERVRSEGEVLLASDELALVRVHDEDVVRVGTPSMVEWGGWRYGTLLNRSRRPGLLRRVLGSLPPAPLEGYDPYGFTGPLGGVAGRGGLSEWLGSPFLDRAQPLTLGFAAVPFAPSCPSCGIPMPLQPWDFSRVTFHITSGRPAVEARCGHCGVRVSLLLDEARASLRFGLGILDSDREAREHGESAGHELERVGGDQVFVRGLGRSGSSLGELGRVERVALGIALDRDAEAHALESEWREAEEIAAIMDGELTEVPGFVEFRERVLRGSP